MDICTYINKYTFICKYNYVYSQHTYLHKHTHIYIYMCVCVYIYIYLKNFSERGEPEEKESIMGQR